VSRATTSPVAVLDSSVLVPEWSRIVLQRLAEPPRQDFVPIWSEWIIAETWRVLAWQWAARSTGTDDAEWRLLSNTANAMLRYLLRAMRLVSLRDVSGPAPWPELRDPNDVPIWETAVAANAWYVVSHNVADFPPLAGGRHRYGDIEYLTAIEFVEYVLGAEAADVYERPLPIGTLVRSGRVP